uniref:Uncharacterized protein n=1 Tax=Calcidiscus leptoporus TaxID=127549 RepID=A0A6U5HNL6_9EUKA
MECTGAAETSIEEEADVRREEPPPVAPSLARAAAEEGATRGTLLPRQLCARFDADFLAAHGALWAKISVVIGMHPDEATEPIVDAALAHGKPFAVLPCCVFPKSNTHRACRNGLPVLSHEQFCTYLQEKHPGIRRTRLSRMEGRNVLLWYLPDYCDVEEEMDQKGTRPKKGGETPEGQHGCDAEAADAARSGATSPRDRDVSGGIRAVRNWEVAGSRVICEQDAPRICTTCDDPPAGVWIRQV